MTLPGVLVAHNTDMLRSFQETLQLESCVEGLPGIVEIPDSFGVSLPEDLMDRPVNLPVTNDNETPRLHQAYRWRLMCAG